MDPEVARFVEYLDDRIRALQEIKDSIVERFADADSLAKRVLRARHSEPNTKPARSGGNLLLEAPHGNSGNGQRGPGTRKDQIVNFLRATGPSTRSEIRDGTGIPVGTLATTLNDRTMFRNREGRWHLIEQRDSAGQ